MHPDLFILLEDILVAWKFVQLWLSCCEYPCAGFCVDVSFIPVFYWEKSKPNLWMGGWMGEAGNLGEWDAPQDPGEQRVKTPEPHRVASYEPIDVMTSFNFFVLREPDFMWKLYVSGLLNIDDLWKPCLGQIIRIYCRPHQPSLNPLSEFKAHKQTKTLKIYRGGRESECIFKIDDTLSSPLNT